jgi:hypothetical protein
VAPYSEREGDGAGEASLSAGDSAGELLFSGAGDASAFFLAALAEDEELDVVDAFFLAVVVEEAVVPVFFVVEAVVPVFFSVDVVALVVAALVVAVSFLAHEVKKPTPIKTAVKANANFFIGMVCLPESVHPAGASQAYS